ncbi:MAG TPA: 4Fe-4S dicluster domain-containing protein [Candidatus Acidoferrales bacterium]|jgi:Fe-S-cluster-containing hydrogenase component 2|nr:4Fe-4S dicluster domain-containing protein [Candidatus Acidoferrales bacterium]
MAEVVTVNIKRCENCGVCEIACAERHGGKARLKVKDVLQSRGLAFNDEVLPIICKQCEKPTCIEACKTNALKREDGIIYIDEEKCVGCGRCTKVCPFNAIFIEEVPSSPAPEPFEPGFLSMLFTRNKVAKTSHKRKPKTTRRAFKCDQCRGFENMACVDACFFKALSLRDLNTLASGKGEHAVLLKQQLTREEIPSET